jgi:hypothetical protein
LDSPFVKHFLPDLPPEGNRKGLILSQEFGKEFCIYTNNLKE